jgi:putative hemolysin
MTGPMEDDSSSFLLLGFSIVVLVFMYAFFCLAAVVLSRARERVIEKPESELKFGKARALQLLDKAEHVLLGMHAGVYLTTFFGGGALVFFLNSAPVSDFVSSTVSQSNSTLAAPALCLFIMLMVALVAQVLSQLAKAIGASNPELVLCYLATPIDLSSILLSPLVSIANSAGKSLVSGFGLEPAQERELTVSAEELEEIVEHSSEAGLLEEDEGEMIQGVVRFSDTFAREVMTPRKDIVAVDVSASIEKARDLFLAFGLSRLLVIEGDLDNVRGVLLAKDLMPLLGEDLSAFTLSGFVRQTLVVPGTMYIDDLLELFKRKTVHFAVVSDEHGGVDGLLTLEDLLEEIVGDIFDEHDIPDEFAEFERTRSGDLLVDGSALIEDLNIEHPEYSFPLGEYDTIAGLIIHHLGKIPTEGEVFEYNGVTIRVEEVEQHRIQRVRIVEKSAEAEAEPVDG